MSATTATTPVATPAPTSAPADNAFDAFMAGVQSVQDGLRSTQESTPAPVVDSAPKTAPEAAQNTTQAVPQPADVPPKAEQKQPTDINSPQFAAVQAKFRELKAQEAKYKDLEAKVKELDELKGLKNTPEAVFDRLGLDPNAVARALLARAGVKQEAKAEQSTLQAEIAEIRAQMQAINKERDELRKAAEEERTRKAVDNTREEVQKFLEGSQAHSLAKALKAVDAIIAARNKHYAMTADVGEPEDLTWAQAADLVEKQMRDELAGLSKIPEVQKLIGLSAPSTPTASESSQAAVSGPNLSSSKFSGPTAPANPNATGEDLMRETLAWLKAAGA